MPEPREGTTLFIAGSTPGWGDLEILCNGIVIDGVKRADTHYGLVVVYARDHNGHWPVVDAVEGSVVTYTMFGKIEVREVYPPDAEFEAPRNRTRKGKSKGGTNVATVTPVR